MISIDKTLQVGDRVVKTMGIRLLGTVIAPFPWREQNDGGYKEPIPGEVPVQWDDGTKGYVSPLILDYLRTYEQIKNERRHKETVNEAIQDALQEPGEVEGDWYDAYLTDRA